jgi:hypothetical protein
VAPHGSCRARIIACVAVLPLAAACSTGAGQQPETTVTVTHTNPPKTPAKTTPTTAPRTKATRYMSSLPGTCAAMLPLSLIDARLGRAIKGSTTFLVGSAEPTIGRMAYLNCRYGLPSGAAAATATPKLEIGISLYQSSVYAARRIPATVDDYANHGASETDVTVDGVHAAILTMASGAGYADPTIVAASGQRTIAITLVETAGGNVVKDLSALAKLALQRSGG